MKKFWEKHKRPIIVILFGSAAVAGYVTGCGVAGFWGGMAGAVGAMIAIPVFSLMGMFCMIPIFAVLALICACIGWVGGDDTAFDEL